MTIPSKGARRIVVDGTPFRWSVRSRPTYSQGLAQSGLTLAGEHAEGPGCTLHLRLPTVRTDNWLHHPGYVVQPSDVARWVQLAIRRGWDPVSRAPTFALSLEEADLAEGQRPPASALEREP